MAFTHNFSIHDKTEAPKALYTRVPTPENFKSQYEKDKYWDLEKVKWIEGYSGITGPHYLMIQEMRIPDAFGRMIRPWWRDCDSMIFETYADALKAQWDMFVLKRREIGLSTIGGGVLPLHTALLNPGSTSIGTSADKDRLKELFSKKLISPYEALHPDIQPPRARTRQEGFVIFGKEVIAAHGKKKIEGLNSSIVFKETIKNPQALEAYRALYGFLDELFLHPKAGDARSSAARCFMDGTDKIGVMLMGGTCGKGTIKGADEGKLIYKESKARKILTLFLSGALGLKQFSVNGWSDLKAGEEWVLRNREELGKAEDKTDYYKFLTDYPLTEEEVLNLITETIWPQEIKYILDTAQSNIAKEGVTQKKYTLSRTEGHGVIAKADDKNGKYVIIEPPIAGRLYISGTDPIPFGNARIGDGSDYAISIKDFVNNKHVAYYMERNLSSKIVFQNASMLQDLYYGAKTMLELNRGEVIYKEYMDAGRLDLLAPMPTHLGIKFEKRLHNHGVYKNTHIEERANKFVVNWILEHGFKIRILELIDQLRVLTMKNTDLADSVLMDLVYHEDLKEQMRRSYKNTQTTEVVTIEWINGVRRRVVKEVKVNIPGRL